MYLKTHLGLESFILQKGNKVIRECRKEETSAVRGTENSCPSKTAILSSTHINYLFNYYLETHRATFISHICSEYKQYVTI